MSHADEIRDAIKDEEAAAVKPQKRSVITAQVNINADEFADSMIRLGLTLQKAGEDLKSGASGKDEWQE